MSDNPSGSGNMNGNFQPSSSNCQPSSNILRLSSGDNFDTSPKMYCVQPLDYCPHLELLAALPEEGLNPFDPCERCSDTNENWVCLQCFKVFCGRFIHQHMVDHSKSTGHTLTLSYSDLSVWCYVCDAYVHNPVLTPVKELVHSAKFANENPRP